MISSAFRSGFVLLAACGLAACSSADLSPTSPSSLPGESSAALESAANVTWRLESFRDAQGRPVALPAGAIFSIAFSDGRVAVQSDCNRCTASAVIAGDSVDIGLTMACTRAFCSSSPVDGQFEAALMGRHTAALQNSRLTLTSPRGVLGFSR
jgi:heat shock protein HslJ